MKEIVLQVGDIVRCQNPSHVYKAVEVDKDAKTAKVVLFFAGEEGDFLWNIRWDSVLEIVGGPTFEAETEDKEFAVFADALRDLQALCHRRSVDAGWWHDINTGEKYDPVAKGPEKICLMHSELSETMEGLRKGLQDDKLPHRPMAEVELADCVIRIFDWAGAMGYDVGGAIVEKMQFNKTRPDHQIENRKADGGKKF